MGKKSNDEKVGGDALQRASLEQTPHGPAAQSNGLTIQSMTQDELSIGGVEATGILLEESEISDEVKLDPKVQAHLGSLLRSMYQGLVDEPVPERFLKVLEELDRSEKDE